MLPRWFALSVLVSCCPGSAWASFDEFSDRFSEPNFALHSEDLTLTLKGELEIELHDIEGRGGPGFDSVTDTRTLGTRSPTVELDSFWLAFRLRLSDAWQVNSFIEASTRDARAGAAWFDGWFEGPRGFEHHVEVGFHTPFIKIDRRTERYPLIGTIYWRSSELHAVHEGFLRLTKNLSVITGLSVAMMRPLTFASVQESSTNTSSIQVISYGEARSFSGNAPVLGAKLGIRFQGLELEGFAFRGRLANRFGTDVLRTSINEFASLNPEGSGALSHAFHWYGGRLRLLVDRLLFTAEAIESRESLLRRYGAYAQVSVPLSLLAGDYCHRIEPILRVETLRLRDSTVPLTDDRALRSPSPAQSATWGYRVGTAAILLAVFRDLVRFRAEYSWIGERNGVRALAIARQPIRNNEFLAQVELRF